MSAIFPPRLPHDRRLNRPTILALNSGSSSLKFGLYRVGPSRTELLLSGEAESIGDKESKFHAQDSRKNALPLRGHIHSQPTGSDYSHRQTSCRLQNAGAGRHRASNRAWRTETPAALPH